MNYRSTLLLLLLCLAACARPVAQPPQAVEARRPSQQELPSMSPEETRKKMDAHEPLVIIDVRSPGQYREQRIAGAINLPLSDIEARRAEIPTDKPVVLYCGGGGCPMSHKATEKLVGLGFGNVYDLKGGILDWKNLGYPTESGAGAANP